MSIGSSHDPRDRLVREKYFSLRPKPLERWLWAQCVPPAAERVFWLHWQEGQQRGDWCSEIPLKRVAVECQLDVSTVTRAYQVLQRMGCLRRTDPGRDPANPFQQATAVTEVRVPREFLTELDRYPSRRTSGGEGRSATRSLAAAPEHRAAVAPTAEEGAGATDPFAHLAVKARLKALAQLTELMSAGELQRYRQGLAQHQAHMSFDPDSKLGPEQRGTVLQVLGIASRVQPKPAAESVRATPTVQARQLTVFELARLRREIQAATSSLETPELTRQVIWSIEQGALQRFSPLHALHIALKKIREGTWTRPHRMPPNWMGTLSRLETCRSA